MNIPQPEDQTVRSLADGRYQVTDLIARGGMGEIYEATDTRLKRKVAIKFLRSDITSDRLLRRRFETEAMAAARLSNENVTTVYDVGEEGNRPYIVMELVDRRTLRDRIAEGRLPIAESVVITIQVLRALSAAHQAGILHRDIKPSNILFGWDGQAKVSDFGIATIIEASADDLEATSTMELFGTPSYLAPERALGERPTAMSDIYSVGTVLYEMITGVKPFVAETPMAVIMSAQSGKYVLASELNAQVSSYIDAVISKALNPNPSERFLTANEMIVTLAGQSNDDATRILPTAAFGVTSAIPVLADLDTTERTERIATIESVAKQKKPSWRSKEVLFALIAVLVVAIFVMWSTLGSSSGSKIKSFPTTSTIPAQIIPSTTTSSTTTSSTTTSSTTTTAPTPPGPPGKGGPPGQSKNK